MPEPIYWSAEGSNYIGSRSARYLGAVDIEPDWTQEALSDPDLIAFEPDPKSRIGAARFSVNHLQQGWCWWWSATGTWTATCMGSTHGQPAERTWPCTRRE